MFTQLHDFMCHADNINTISQYLHVILSANIYINYISQYLHKYYQPCVFIRQNSLVIYM